MSQLLGIVHGREETFPAALLAEINGRGGDVHAESLSVSGVEALDSSPFRVLVDRISPRVAYFRSFVRQNARLGVLCFPHHDLPSWDRVELAQVALSARVACVPTMLLPHQTHPAGVDGSDLGNLAYPMPWEQYLDRFDLPGLLRPATLGPGAAHSFESLADLWQVYGRCGDALHVIQPDLSDLQRIIAVVCGSHVELMGYEPLSGRFLEPLPEAQKPILQAVSRLRERAELLLTGLEFAWHPGRKTAMLTDLHLTPELDWWRLGEAAFSRVVSSTADELMTRALSARPRK